MRPSAEQSARPCALDQSNRFPGIDAYVFLDTISKKPSHTPCTPGQQNLVPSRDLRPRASPPPRPPQTQEKLPPPPPPPPLDAPWKPPPPGFDARTLRRQAASLRGEAAAALRDEEAVRGSSAALAELLRAAVENGEENVELGRERLRRLHASLVRLRRERRKDGEAVEAAVAWQESLEELRCGSLRRGNGGEGGGGYRVFVFALRRCWIRVGGRHGVEGEGLRCSWRGFPVGSYFHRSSQGSS